MFTSGYSRMGSRHASASSMKAGVLIPNDDDNNNGGQPPFNPDSDDQLNDQYTRVPNSGNFRAQFPGATSFAWENDDTYAGADGGVRTLPIVSPGRTNSAVYTRHTQGAPVHMCCLFYYDDTMPDDMLYVSFKWRMLRGGNWIGWNNDTRSFNQYNQLVHPDPDGVAGENRIWLYVHEWRNGSEEVNRPVRAILFPRIEKTLPYSSPRFREGLGPVLYSNFSLIPHRSDLKNGKWHVAELVPGAYGSDVPIQYQMMHYIVPWTLDTGLCWHRLKFSGTKPLWPLAKDNDWPDEGQYFDAKHTAFNPNPVPWLYAGQSLFYGATRYLKNGEGQVDYELPTDAHAAEATPFIWHISGTGNVNTFEGASSSSQGSTGCNSNWPLLKYTSVNHAEDNVDRVGFLCTASKDMTVNFCYYLSQQKQTPFVSSDGRTTSESVLGMTFNRLERGPDPLDTTSVVVPYSF